MNQSSSVILVKVKNIEHLIYTILSKLIILIQFLYISMQRSQSSETTRFSYQKISSRIQRLRRQSSVNSALSKHNTPSYTSAYPSGIAHQPTYTTSKLPSSHRSNLKIQDNGMFGLDISNCVGRVSKNTGIKKYNQKQIKDAVQRNSTRINHEEDLLLKRQSYDIIGKYRQINEKLTSSPRYRNSPEQVHLKSAYSSAGLNFYDYTQENALNPQPMTSGPLPKYLEPGKIYTLAELNQLLTF